jgi:hypothetical protein
MLRVRTSVLASPRQASFFHVRASRPTVHIRRYVRTGVAFALNGFTVSSRCVAIGDDGT